jgi:hypothetical protein
MLTWPFPFGVRLSWLTARTPNPDPCRAVGHVYFLRGHGLVFSRGFGLMCAAMRRAGWWAEDLRGVGDLWLRRHVLREHHSGRLRGPLVMVGHSCGGRSALHVARYLQPHGITVQLILCVDVAFAPQVPANVAHAVHLYRSRRRLYPAAPLTPVEGSPGVVENVDLDAADAPLDACGLYHLNFTAQPAVQGWVLSRIGAVVEAAKGPLDSAQSLRS